MDAEVLPHLIHPGQTMPNTCTHLDQVREVEPRPPDGCEECLQSGDRWVHLRICLTCGHVGCCDQSPNRHATKHFQTTKHPIIQSFEPNEDWSWCYVDEVVLEPEQIESAIAGSRNSASANGEGGGMEAGAPGGLLSRVLAAPFRRNYVVGVIDDPATAERAAQALRDGGFDAEHVVLQSASEISDRLEKEDIGNLVREATTEEGALCRDYDELSDGGAVLSVYTSSDEEVERASRTMAESGAHSLRHFGNWTITDIPAGHV